MQTICQFATFHGPRLVYQTQQDPGHTIWFSSWQRHAAPAVYSVTSQRCSTKDADGLITAVHSINFKQAYDSIPRSKMWDHLRKDQTHMLSIPKNLYNTDEYTLLHPIGWG